MEREMEIDVACGYEVLPVVHEPLELDLHHEQKPLSVVTLIALHVGIPSSSRSI